MVWGQRPPRSHRSGGLRTTIAARAHSARETQGIHSLCRRVRIGLVAWVIAAALTGCDQVQKRLIGVSQPPAVESDRQGSDRQGPDRQGPDRQGPAPGLPADAALLPPTPAQPATVTVTDGQNKAPEASPGAITPTTPDSPERFSSHQGSSGTGPIERRSSSSARQ